MKYFNFIVETNTPIIYTRSMHLKQQDFISIILRNYQNYNQGMKIYIILVTLLLVCQLHCHSSDAKANPQFNAGQLPYQAHGFNNLDIARHLLLKGVKYFKFDASLANKQSCMKNSNWNYSNPCLNNTEYAQQICCIAMRGDLGSQPNFNYPFNTSNQFVALIDKFLAQYQESIEILFIAIDFQFNFAYTNKIAQKFLYDLAGLMYKYPKVYITTKGDYILQFDKICRFHSFMNQNDEACTPERNYISKSRFFLQSSSYNPVDSRDYRGRFQNFNTIYKDIDNLCRNGFPTWMNKYPKFPLIFWQPSNQRQIQNSIHKLMDPSCKSKHNRTLSGIAFASNLEPEMFEVMMKQTVHSSTGSLWKFQQQKLFFEYATGIKMAKIISSNMQQQLALYKKTQTNNVIKHFLYVLSKESQNLISIKKFIELQKEVTELYAVKNTIVAVMRDNYNEQTKEYSATLTAFTNDLQVSSTLSVQGYLTGFSSGDLFYYLELTSIRQIFNTYVVNETLKKPIQYKVSVFMQRSKIDSITSMYFQKAAKAEQDIMLIIGNNVNKTWVAQIKNSEEHSVKDIVFGTNAKIISQGNSSFALIVQNSYSHGGLLINNNAQNTCIYHKINDLKPLATVPHLLNLLQGKISDLVSFINDESEDIITACNHDFIFTKIMNGGQSELIQIWDYLIISTKFIPIQKLDFLTTLFTGGSNFQPEFRNKNGFLLSSLSTNKGWGQIMNEKIVVEQ